MHRELKSTNLWLSYYKSRNTNRYKGLTLTEVVVASALLLIAMVPILKALTSAQVSATIIEQKTCSLMLAQAKLEDIKARSIYSYNSSFAETNTSVDGSYLCTVTDSGSVSDLRQITVEVGHDLDGSSTLEAQEVNVTLSTLVARRW
ncbi:MAG: type IV pilus modification PilV family protein [Planctomycetota bacterium]|jgi:Tfp pilus assembly protein PilV